MSAAPTDWNDLANLVDLDAVRKGVAGAVPAVPPPDWPEPMLPVRSTQASRRMGARTIGSIRDVITNPPGWSEPWWRRSRRRRSVVGRS